MKPEPLRFLGIDPGSLCTGYGVIEEATPGLRLLDAGAIRTSAGDPLATRLALIFAGIEGVIARFSPHEVAVESLFHAKNARSALMLGHARGVALLAAARSGLPVHEYAPQEVKKALVGTGRAEKHQVESMVRLLLRLSDRLRPHDAADGVAVAICHAHARRLGTLASADQPARAHP